MNPRSLLAQSPELQRLYAELTARLIPPGRRNPPAIRPRRQPWRRWRARP